MADTMVQAQPNRGYLVWFGLVGGHTAWSLQVLLNYFIVSLACRAGPTEFTVPGIPGVHLVTGLVTAGAAAGALAAVGASFREWQAAGKDQQADPTNPDDHRFLALVGMLLSGLYVVVILLVGTSHVFIDPFAGCGRG